MTLKTTLGLVSVLLASACGHASASQSKSVASEAKTFHSVACHSRDNSLTLSIDLQAANVELTQKGTTTEQTADVSVFVGAPGTRLTGITWIQAKLAGGDNINALVKSDSGANNSSSAKIAGANIYLVCTAI